MSFDGGASDPSSSLSSFGVDSILRLRPSAMSMESCVPASGSRGSVPFSALISDRFKTKKTDDTPKLNMVIHFKLIHILPVRSPSRGGNVRVIGDFIYPAKCCNPLGMGSNCGSFVQASMCP